MWEPFQQTTRGIPFRGMLRKDFSWQGIYMNLLSIAFSPVKRLVQLILVGPKLTTTWVPENLSFRANLKCLMSQFSGVAAAPKKVYKPQKSPKMFFLLMIIGQQNDKIQPEDESNWARTVFFWEKRTGEDRFFQQGVTRWVDPISIGDLVAWVGSFGL